MRRFCLNSTVVLEPILLFCTHAIRFRDTRCCSVVLRVLRSIIPDFKQPTETVIPIREFVSTEVLKACVTSLHEPYFVDLQRGLAELIASILYQFCPQTPTPRAILLSLPGMSQTNVDRAIEAICHGSTQSRQQRAVVLDLLADLKGVSISEQGRLTKTAGAVRKERSKMQQEFMKIDEGESSRGAAARAATPDLSGVAGMFDG